VNITVHLITLGTRSQERGELKGECSLLSKYSLLVLTLLLMASLSSCLMYYPLKSVYGFGVKNVVNSNSVGIPKTFEVCPGGLQAQMSFLASGGLLKSDIVVVGSTYSENIQHGSKVGDPLVIEAWCFGAGSEEVGYIKYTSKLYSGSPVYNVEVYPSVIPNPDLPSGVVLCPKGSEERGTKIPCLSGSGF
jgi:hypothetical protein